MVTGLTLAPVFVIAYALVDDLAPQAARTEASTWVNTAYNVGIALGAAGAGALVDARGPGTALIAAAVVLAITTAALTRRRP